MPPSRQRAAAGPGDPGPPAPGTALIGPGVQFRSNESDVGTLSDNRTPSSVRESPTESSGPAAATARCHPSMLASTSGSVTSAVPGVAALGTRPADSAAPESLRIARVATIATTARHVAESASATFFIAARLEAFTAAHPWLHPHRWPYGRVTVSQQAAGV